MGGVFEMRRKAQIELKLPEFTHNKMVKWITHVDETTDPTKTQYDLIIGSDLMHELNIIIDYRQKHIVWDDVAGYPLISNSFSSTCFEPSNLFHNH